MSTEEDSFEIPVRSKEELKPKLLYMNNLISASKIFIMWPRTGNTNAVFYHLSVWVMICCLISFFFSFAIQITIDYKNIDTITALVDFVTVFISGTFRYIYIYVRGDTYLFLVSVIHKKFIHYSLFPSEKIHSILNHYNYGNKLVVGYSAFCFIWILQICLMPMSLYFWEKSKQESLNETEIEPIPYPTVFKTYAPFDYYQQPANVIFYIYQTLGFVIFAWNYMIMDSFWYMVIVLTIGQFYLIKESINTLTEIVTKSDNEKLEFLNETQTRKLDEALKHCIKHHQFIRRFVRLMDNILNPIILIDFLHAVTSIGFILLDVTIALNDGNWHKLMYSLQYFITSVVHMFFFDWLANELAVHEEEIAEGIYNLPWYKCPKLKPVVQLLTMQCRRPYRLTGGKMYRLSLELFTSMLKAIFSYFTFLFQLRNDTSNV